MGGEFLEADGNFQVGIASLFFRNTGLTSQGVNATQLRYANHWIEYVSGFAGFGRVEIGADIAPTGY